MEKEAEKIPAAEKIQLRKSLKRKRLTKTNAEPIILTEVEEEGKKDLPVFELASNYYFDGVESDEKVLGDDERGEIDKGYKYIVNENELTYTRVKVPIKIYFTDMEDTSMYVYAKNFRERDERQR
ncbi:hypothetical protein AgCh_037221 [Apium graveolens]